MGVVNLYPLHLLYLWDGLSWGNQLRLVPFITAWLGKSILTKPQLNQTKQNDQQINKSWVWHNYYFALPHHHPKIYFQHKSNTSQYSPVPFKTTLLRQLTIYNYLKQITKTPSHNSCRQCGLVVLYLLYFIFINFVDPRLTDRQTAIATYITAIAAKYMGRSNCVRMGLS
jgi:hypothetical protein